MKTRAHQSALTAMTLVIAAAALLAFAGGCSARRGEPFKGPFVASDAVVEHGRVVFMEHCHKCHPGGEAGLGPAINDKPLPEFLMKIQIRTGLGAMPSFKEHELSSEDADAVIRYLKALRGRRGS
jgi:mono/diheme cytochrome c family protein